MANLEATVPNGSSLTSVDINNSIKNQIRCDLCDINLSNQSELDKHRNSKHHAKNSAIKQRKEKEVYLVQLGSLTKQDVQSYLSQYGKIVKVLEKYYNTGSNLQSAFVQFETKEEVSNLLTLDKKHKVPLSPKSNETPRYHTMLVLESTFKPTTERKRSPSPDPCPSIDHSDVIDRLTKHTDPQDQIRELVQCTMLHDQDVLDREDICRRIHQTFSRKFPNCMVYSFGSSVNGLGFRGCDLDVYVDIGGSDYTGCDQDNPLLDIPAMLEKQKVYEATRLLRSIPQCSQIQPIPSARVPIVKFVHRSTGIHCDMSFKNRASSCNTKFIRMCVGSDKRIRPVMVTIRYFAKKYDLAGGGGKMRMSNYALTMMIIFYLQQIDNPLLHPVSVYQEDVEPDLISGWNCAFTREDDLHLLPRLPQNNLNVLQLVTGFFTFYAAYNFKDLIICPILGRSISRKDVGRGKPLPYPLSKAPVFIGRDKLLIDKPICLQDPFELCFNVCKNLPQKALTILKCHFQEAGNLCKAMLEPQTCPSAGILSLFELEVNVPDEPEPVEEPDVALADETRDSISSFNGNVIKIDFPAEFVQNGENNFQDESIKLVRRIFRDCLKFEMKKAVDIESKIESGCDNEKDMSDMGSKRSISVSCDDTCEPKKRLKSNDDVKSIDGSHNDKLENEDISKSSKEDGEIIDAGEASKIIKSKADTITIENEDSNASKEDGEIDGSDDEEPSNTSKLFMGLNYQEEDSSSKSTCDEWTVWTPVWVRRKKIKSQMVPMQDTFKLESLISEKIIKECFGGARLPEPDVVFQVHPIFNKISENPPVYQRCVWLGLKDVNSRKKTFETMFQWLSSYLPNIVTEITEYGET